MKKQKHVDDLLGEVSQLRKNNNKILESMNVTTQLYVNLEAENSVLRAQMGELTNRLQSLNDIMDCINSTNWLVEATEDAQIVEGLVNNPWNSIHVNQPIMAAAHDHIFMY
jgi:hypothetical protein